MTDALETTKDQLALEAEQLPTYALLMTSMPMLGKKTSLSS